jgi:hypothetical protein
VDYHEQGSEREPLKEAGMTANEHDETERRIKMRAFVDAVSRGDVPGHEDRQDAARRMMESGEVDARWPRGEK